MMILLIVALHITGKRHRKTRLSSIINIISRIPFAEPTNRDKANWIYRYSHPYFRAKGVTSTFEQMNKLNSPVSLESKLFSRLK